jgi:hypothetical protein
VRVASRPGLFTPRALHRRRPRTSCGARAARSTASAVLDVLPTAGTRLRTPPPQLPITRLLGDEQILARIHALDVEWTHVSIEDPAARDWPELAERAAAAGQPWADELASHVETLLAIAHFVDTCERPGPVVLTHKDIQPWNLLARDGRPLDLRAIKEASGRNGTLAVDGLVYAGLPVGSTVAEWLAALRYRAPHYSAQPYQQLAAATRAAGHDGDTRRVLMAQRRDQIRRSALTAVPERTWAKTTGILLGYGYQPWRALLYLIAVLAAAVTLAIIAGGHHGGLAHPARATLPNTACTTMEQIGVGIDLGLPLIKTNARESCITTSTRAGQARPSPPVARRSKSSPGH